MVGVGMREEDGVESADAPSTEVADGASGGRSAVDQPPSPVGVLDEGSISLSNGEEGHDETADWSRSYAEGDAGKEGCCCGVSAQRKESVQSERTGESNGWRERRDVEVSEDEESDLRGSIGEGEGEQGRGIGKPGSEQRAGHRDPSNQRAGEEVGQQGEGRELLEDPGCHRQGAEGRAQRGAQRGRDPREPPRGVWGDEPCDRW